MDHVCCGLWCCCGSACFVWCVVAVDVVKRRSTLRALLIPVRRQPPTNQNLSEKQQPHHQEQINHNKYNTTIQIQSDGKLATKNG